VQDRLPGGKLLTIDAASRIDAVATPADAAALVAERELAAGDLVYLPRGVVHRGVGGALVMVITVPGFVPGAEIGVDHLLRAKSEALGVAIPYNAAASTAPVTR